MRQENKRRAELPEILTYDEIDRFLVSLAEEGPEALIMGRLMLMGGLRIAEAASVRPKDLVPANPCSVFVESGKGGKDRYAPIDVATFSHALCHSLDQELLEDVAIYSRTVRTLQNRIKSAYLRAGLLHDGCSRELTAHTLRHTCATWQLDQGVPLEVVRENLGHEDITTTQIYLHLNIRQRSRMYSEVTRFGV